MGLHELGGWPAVLGALTAGRDLSADEAGAAMAEILAGDATPAQIAGFIVALRMKGETVEELTGLVNAMLAVSPTVPLTDPDAAVDIVGTGGDRSQSINVSALAAIVVAGAGTPVCKHGNRSASSACGSADVLEALGVTIDLGPEGVARCVEEAGIGFCFAQRFHPSMRHAAPARRELGVPTVFNFLGPMANPARVRRHLIGVSDPRMAERMAEVLRRAGAQRALVVYGHDGLDELTTTTTSSVVDVAGDQVRTYTVDPAALGFGAAEPRQLVGGDPATNAELARRVLAADAGPHRDVVILNAAAGLVAAGRCSDMDAAVVLAARSLDDGHAAEALERLVATSAAAAEEEAAGRG